MFEEKVLHFQVVSNGRETSLDFPVRQIICAGYSGRSQDAVQEHVKEMLALGMPAPEETPIFFKVSTYLATSATSITVQDRSTSGEAEFVLLFHNGETYVTCGSDHTDRALEKHSIPGAKQMYPKIVATQVWRFSEVREQWDRLTLRSWSTTDGVRHVYQDATLSHILQPEELLRRAEKRFKPREIGTMFMSGTIPTVGGEMVYADAFSYELHDPVLNRTIRHAYDVVQLG